MSKYLELFKGSFNDSINEKTKPENKPYIGYSLTEGKLAYTVVPKPVVGPADNEIWYTTTDGNALNFEGGMPYWIGNTCVIDNTYSQYGILKLEGDIKYIEDGKFSGLKTLKSMSIPVPLISIGNGCFRNCTSLETITYNGTMEQFNLARNGRQIVFENCPEITVHCTDGDITIPAAN